MKNKTIPRLIMIMGMIIITVGIFSNFYNEENENLLEINKVIKYNLESGYYIKNTYEDFSVPLISTGMLFIFIGLHFLGKFKPFEFNKTFLLKQESHIISLRTKGFLICFLGLLTLIIVYYYSAFNILHGPPHTIYSRQISLGYWVRLTYSDLLVIIGQFIILFGFSHFIISHRKGSTFPKLISFGFQISIIGFCISNIANLYWIFFWDETISNTTVFYLMKIGYILFYFGFFLLLWGVLHKRYRLYLIIIFSSLLLFIIMNGIINDLLEHDFFSTYGMYRTIIRVNRHFYIISFTFVYITTLKLYLDHLTLLKKKEK